MKNGTFIMFRLDPRTRLIPVASSYRSKDVTFLYKMADGVCPKSYGMNVARMAVRMRNPFYMHNRELTLKATGSG